MARLVPTLSYDDLKSADMIIEAVFETMAVKKDVFGKLDKVAKKGAILASNTSYLSIDEIAAATARPADVLGTHFFSPANVMRLLEIVRGGKTAPDVLATVIGSGETHQQGRRRRRQQRWIHRQSHAQRLCLSSPVDGARGRKSRSGRWRSARFRHAHGRVADARSSRAGYRLQIPQGSRPEQL